MVSICIHSKNFLFLVYLIDIQIYAAIRQRVKAILV